MLIMNKLNWLLKHRPQKSPWRRLRHPFKHNGVTRHYFLQIPSGTNPLVDSAQAVPLVLAFHGGQGSARRSMNWMGFNPLANQDRCILAYPVGIKRHWTDGFDKAGFDPTIDDVGFIQALVDHLVETYPIDQRQIYAVGVSNGGAFVHRLACEASDRITAAAAVIASIAPQIAQHYQEPAAQPVSFLSINGTRDPFFPYEGGYRRKQRTTGYPQQPFLSAQETLHFWAKRNGCDLDNSSVETTQVGKRQLQKTSYCTGSTKAELYTIVGGGHRWPGSQGLLAKLSRKSDQQVISASHLIWDFFMDHRSQTRNTEADIVATLESH